MEEDYNEGESKNYEENLNKGTLYYYNKKKVESFNFKTFNVCEDLKSYPNMNCIITSKTNSGKSVFLKDMCYELRHNYNSAYVFSLTAHLQPDLFDFIPEENVINAWDEELLDQIFHNQESMVIRMKKQGIKDDKIPRVLIIYDDLISEPTVAKSKVLKKLFVMGRHAKISQIFLTQSFTAVPPVLRKNSALAISFYLDSQVDRDAYAKQYLSTDNVRQGIMVLERITKEPYTACCVLNCITSQNPEDTIRTYKARLKVPKFIIGKRIQAFRPVEKKGPVPSHLEMRINDD